jgi:hypothetical protein
MPANLESPADWRRDRLRSGFTAAALAVAAVTG